MIIHQGSPQHVVNHYALSSWLNPSAALHNTNEDMASLEVSSRGFWDVNLAGQKTVIEAEFDANRLQDLGKLCLTITSSKATWLSIRMSLVIAQIGQRPFLATSVQTPSTPSDGARISLSTIMDVTILNKGWYSITIYLLENTKEGREIALWPRALSFEIKGNDNVRASEEFPGPIVYPTTWQYNPSP